MKRKEKQTFYIKVETETPKNWYSICPDYIYKLTSEHKDWEQFSNSITVYENFRHLKENESNLIRINGK